MLGITPNITNNTDCTGITFYVLKNHGLIKDTDDYNRQTKMSLKIL